MLDPDAMARVHARAALVAAALTAPAGARLNAGDVARHAALVRLRTRRVRRERAALRARRQARDAGTGESG